MFISEQYGWCYELLCEFFDAMLDIGYTSSLYIFDHSQKSIRDVDLMLMGL